MTTDPLSLAEELVLLAVQTSPTAHSADALDIGAIGAEVVELALAGRLQMSDGRALVTEPKPLGDPLLDARLADLAAARKPQKLHRYLGQHRRGLRGAYLGRLAAAGLVEERQSRALGLFPYRHWYLTAAGEAAAPRRRLDEVVQGGASPGPRTLALAALARATRMDRALYPGRDGRSDRARLESIARDHPMGQDVARALATLEAVNSAITTAVTMAAFAGTDGGHGGHGGH